MLTRSKGCVAEGGAGRHEQERQEQRVKKAGELGQPVATLAGTGTRGGVREGDRSRPSSCKTRWLTALTDASNLHSADLASIRVDVWRRCSPRGLSLQKDSPLR